MHPGHIEPAVGKEEEDEMRLKKSWSFLCSSKFKLFRCVRERVKQRCAAVRVGCDRVLTWFVEVPRALEAAHTEARHDTRRQEARRSTTAVGVDC